MLTLQDYDACMVVDFTVRVGKHTYQGQRTFRMEKGKWYQTIYFNGMRRDDPQSYASYVDPGMERAAAELLKEMARGPAIGK